MLPPMVNAIRAQQPRIHCITNIVSAPLCANGLLAIGAAPIMAQDLAEVAEITSACQGLCLNLGTPDSRKLQAMVNAGQTASALSRPIVFDPVGVGGSALRMEGAQTLLKAVHCTAIRGNLSELKALASGALSPAGVDTQESIDGNNLPQVVDFAQRFALETGSIIAISGATDVVTDGTTTYTVANGHPMLSAVSGSGCLLSAMMTAYLSANGDAPLLACVASVCALGYCGEQAAKTAKGSGSFAVDLIDELWNLQEKTLELGANYALYER